MIPIRISLIMPMTRDMASNPTDRSGRFKIGKRIRLTAKDNPTLKRIGILRLLKIGAVSKIALTLKKMKRNICTWGREMLIDSMDHRFAFKVLAAAFSACEQWDVAKHVLRKVDHELKHPGKEYK